MRKNKKEQSKKYAIFAMAGAAALGASVFFFGNAMKAGIIEVADGAAKATGFSVHSIDISGIVGDKARYIREQLPISEGENIFRASAKEMYDKIAAVSFVKSAIVRKNLPNSVSIKIVEKKPVAIFQRESKFFLIDAEGALVEEISARPADFASLPIVTGDDANSQAKAAIDMISKHAIIVKRMHTMTLVRKRRWDIYLDKMVRVMLPESGCDRALDTLSRLLQTDCIKPDITIDMRSMGDVIIRGVHMRGWHVPGEGKTRTGKRTG